MTPRLLRSFPRAVVTATVAAFIVVALVVASASANEVSLESDLAGPPVKGTPGEERFPEDSFSPGKTFVPVPDWDGPPLKGIPGEEHFPGDSFSPWETGSDPGPAFPLILRPRDEDAGG